MTKIVHEEVIAAAPDVVFDVVAHIENYEKAVPHLVSVEFLTETRRGVGTRFRETRLMNGRHAATELEIREYLDNDRVRMVSDAGGTIWDTLFTVMPVSEGTRLILEMEARPYGLFAKFVTPLIKGVVSKSIAQDMAAVKAFCEEKR